MDILFISGSPIKGRNNEKCIEYMEKIALENGFTTDNILISQTNTLPCLDCNHCYKNKSCYNEETNEINEKLALAKAIIICSPVYFGSVSAQLKALFDRTRPLRRHGKLLSNKIGAAAAVGGSRNGGQEMTIACIHSWMHIHGMVIVGDNSHFGAILKVKAMEDKEGLVTLEGTIEKVCKILRELR